MADQTFTYTDSTPTTTTLTFPEGKCYFQGNEAYYRRNQEYDKTKGGTPRAKSYGDNFLIQPFTIFVPKYSAPTGDGYVHVTDWIDVIDFINSKVNFGLHEFIWTDADSVAHTVRMENEDTTPKDHATYNEYTFQLRIIS